MTLFWGIVTVAAVAVALAIGVCAIGAIVNASRRGKRYECSASALERPMPPIQPYNGAGSLAEELASMARVYDIAKGAKADLNGAKERPASNQSDLAALVECLRYEVAWLRREVEVANASVAELTRNAMRGQ